MKNISRVLENRKYLLLFVFVMSLNVLLAVFLLHTSFGQTSNIPNQKALDVEIVAQVGSPAAITAINIDNTAETYQIINYTVQNISAKKIKAYALLHTDKSGAGGTSTGFFQSFAAGQIIQSSFVEERVNVAANEKIFLAFDFVVFQDGSAWGKDSQKQSEYIFGHIAGEKDAVKYVRQLLAAANEEAVSKLLQRQLTDINPPAIDARKTAEWQRGFTAGYRSAVGRLQFAYEKQGMDAVRLKLEEVEKFIKAEDK